MAPVSRRGRPKKKVHKEYKTSAGLFTIKTLEATKIPTPWGEETRIDCTIEEFLGSQNLPVLPQKLDDSMFPPVTDTDAPPSVATPGSRSDFPEKCLAEHNRCRKFHGVPPLHLSEELTKASQAKAEELAKRDALPLVINYNSGEIIDRFYCRRPKDMVDAFDIIVRWYEEHKKYDYNEEPIDSETAKFTQVMWNGSKMFGIGAAKSSSNKIYVVANYYPPGNIAGEYSKNVPPAGTPRKTLCVNPWTYRTVYSDDDYSSDSSFDEISRPYMRRSPSTGPYNTQCYVSEPYKNWRYLYHGGPPDAGPSTAEPRTAGVDATKATEALTRVPSDMSTSPCAGSNTTKIEPSTSKASPSEESPKIKLKKTEKFRACYKPRFAKPPLSGRLDSAKAYLKLIYLKAISPMPPTPKARPRKPPPPKKYYGNLPYACRPVPNRPKSAKSSATGGTVNKSSTTGENVNKSSTTGENVNKSSTTGEKVNKSSTTGEKVNKSSTTGEKVNKSSTTGENINKSTTVTNIKSSTQTNPQTAIKPSVSKQTLGEPAGTGETSRNRPSANETYMKDYYRARPPRSRSSVDEPYAEHSYGARQPRSRSSTNDTYDGSYTNRGSPCRGTVKAVERPASRSGTELHPSDSYRATPGRARAGPAANRSSSCDRDMPGPSRGFASPGTPPRKLVDRNMLSPMRVARQVLDQNSARGLAIHNLYRARHGVAPLVYSPELTARAQRRA